MTDENLVDLDNGYDDTLITPGTDDKKKTDWLLWIVPGILLLVMIIGMIAVIVAVAKAPRRKKTTGTTSLSPVTQPPINNDTIPSDIDNNITRSPTDNDIHLAPSMPPPQPTVIGTSSDTVPILTSDEEPIEDEFEHELRLTDTGRLILTSRRDYQVWNSSLDKQEQEKGKYELMLKENGKLCIYSENDELVWCSPNPENDKDGPYTLRFTYSRFDSLLEIANAKDVVVWNNPMVLFPIV